MTSSISEHVKWQQPLVHRAEREDQNGHRSAVLWFTGLSGAGKSTLAHALEARLHRLGVRTYVLDGDNVRHGLCGDLGFTAEDRSENIRRVGEVAKLFVDAGVMVLTAFISPFRADRARARALIGEADFIEVYCHCDLATCESRDVKGLYQKARQGVIKEFTGISSPYEAPDAPALIVDTAKASVDDCVAQILEVLHQRGALQRFTKEHEHAR